MDKQEKEQWIDKLLIFCNDIVEESDRGMPVTPFDFSETGNHYKLFKQEYQIEHNNLTPALKSCLSRGYLKYYYASLPYVGILLTEEGQDRALLVSLARDIPVESTPNIHIGNLYATAAQIGDHNIQNIEIIFKELVEKIDNANVPEEEKQEAKNRLKHFLEHPLVGTALGVGIQALLASLGLGV
jgi:hypothetical protein